MYYTRNFNTIAERLNFQPNYKCIAYTQEDQHVDFYAPFFCRLTLSDNTIINLTGSGRLTKDMVSPYKETLVKLEMGDLCTNIENLLCAGSWQQGCLYPLLNTVIIGDNIDTISTGAFFKCEALTNVILGKNVNYIRSQAFQQTNIQNIVIPDSVVKIESQAFFYCPNLTNITLGSGLQNMNFDNIFQTCSNLESITSLAMQAPTIKNTIFQGVKENGTLYVPIGSTGYDAWMVTDNYYLGKYNWTKVEQ